MAYTWWENTGALWGNPSHPSFNADPYVPDLFPGMTCNVKGSLIFFEGSLAQFEIYFKKELSIRYGKSTVLVTHIPLMLDPHLKMTD